MNIYRSFLFLAALFCATLANATVETNKTPTQMGIRPSANSAYFFIQGNPSAGCGANVIWITLSDSAGLGKLAYATVLAAKSLDKKIAYLEYTKDGFGNCYLVQVDIEP